MNLLCPKCFGSGCIIQGEAQSKDRNPESSKEMQAYLKEIFEIEWRIPQIEGEGEHMLMLFTRAMEKFAA